MTKQQLPSDALTKPATPIRTALLTVAAIAVVAGLGLGGVAVGQTLTAHTTPTAVALPADSPAPLSAAELAAMQATADAWQAQIVADAAAKAAADAAAAQAAQAAANAAAAQAQAAKTGASKATGGLLASGTPVPKHLDTDPNSGSYGQQIISDPGQVCASHSASTVNGVPTCD